MLKKKLGIVLYFGRKNCKFSNKIKNFINKKSQKFYYVESSKMKEKIPKKFFKITYDYIFCFRSFYILKKNLLQKVRKAAINFHPSPPEYRGPGGINYALYNESKFFGSTAHLINEKIDNGNIIDLKRFKIDKNSNIEKILFKTYVVTTNQAFFVINKIIENPKNLKNLIQKNKKSKWSKKIKTIKDLSKFYEIDRNISKKKFLKKMRATYTSKFKPFIFLYGKKFIPE